MTDGLDRRLLEDGIVHVVAALRIGFRIRRHDAVHGLPGLALLPERTERRLRVGRAPAHIEVGSGPGRLLHQADIPVPARGDELQGFLRQLCGCGGRGRIDERRAARDGHGLLQLSDLQLDVHSGGKAGCQSDILSVSRLESREHERDYVGPDRQRGQTVLSLRVADCRDFRNLQRRTPGRDRHAGEYSAAFILHLAADGRGPCLGAHDPGERDQPENDGRRKTEEPTCDLRCRHHGTSLLETDSVNRGNEENRIKNLELRIWNSEC